MSLKKFALLALLTVTLACFAACAASHYKISTLSGKSYVSVGEPKFDDDSKTYSFHGLKRAQGHFEPDPDKRDKKATPNNP